MIKKARNFLTAYLPTAPYVWVYMLQQVEYDAGQFLDWVNRLPSYRRVIKRKKLVLSKKALLLIGFAYAVWLVCVLATVFLLIRAHYIWAALLFAWTPLFMIMALALLVYLMRKPLAAGRKRELGRAREKMSRHKGVKIAVLGSYGKTTAKELLATILSEHKKIAVTPGNMNVAISHARWINNVLTGDEEVVIFEYGEYKPGDIKQLAELTSPEYAIITGYAPNHIDSYKSVEALKNDLRTIQDFVDHDKLFVAESAAAELGLDTGIQFTDKNVLDWKITVVSNGFDGLRMKLSKGKETLDLRSGLVGRHLAPILALVVIIGLEIGVSQQDAVAAAGKTAPFEHRLKPRHLHGAWIIDDTYNGNIAGMRAGLALLKELPAQRKTYVTPGLVEQGSEKERVHAEIAEHIVAANPDRVVLMQNSSTAIIAGRLKELDFANEVVTEDKPLSYYENLQYQVSAGDLVLLQNDWTDNYN